MIFRIDDYRPAKTVREIEERRLANRINEFQRLNLFSELLTIDHVKFVLPEVVKAIAEIIEEREG